VAAENKKGTDSYLSGQRLLPVQI